MFFVDIGDTDADYINLDNVTNIRDDNYDGKRATLVYFTSGDRIALIQGTERHKRFKVALRSALGHIKKYNTESGARYSDAAMQEFGD